MEKLPMCRICLAENVSMYVVVNRNLHRLYEKLTDIPFITKDHRPILACFLCCAKLKQCYKLLRQCLRAEELFIQKLDEDWKLNPLMNQNQLEFFSGYIKSPIVLMNIVDECQTESVAIQVDLPAVCGGREVVIEPKEEHQGDELELGLDNSCLDIAPHHSASDFEDDVVTIKSEEEEEQEVSLMTLRASETRATVAKKAKLDTRRITQQDPITVEKMKTDKSDSEVIWATAKRASQPGIDFREPYECDQRNLNGVTKIITQIGEKPTCAVCRRSFSCKSMLTKHIREKHIGEKPNNCDVCRRNFIEINSVINHNRVQTVEKPFKCDECHRSFDTKCHLKDHFRIHTGEKPHKCYVCHRTFSKKGNLNKHIRTHTGKEQPPLMKI